MEAADRNVTRIKASYLDNSEMIEEFRNNPLIAALPAPLSQREIGQRLLVRPMYHDEDRYALDEKRMDYLQRVIECHVPNAKDISLYIAISRCIRWGYTTRNPLRASYAAALAESDALYGASNYFGRHHSAPSGFAIIGVSGIGKTTTVESILDKFPQVIRHSAYQDTPLIMTQIPWIKIECPGDGSQKSLCLNFFSEIDRLVGTNFYEQSNKSHVTLDRMQGQMARICITYNVGLLVIDEIQGLRVAKNGSEASLNFFISLSNMIGVPVVMIGTPKALSIFQNEFQQAKRGSGQGDFLWSRMTEDNPSWNNYLRFIWQYQYTHDRVDLTDEIKDAIYEETQGIPFVASHLYALVQEDAICTTRETFDEKDFHRVAKTRLGLTDPMRKAMKRDEDVDLHALEAAIRRTKRDAAPDPVLPAATGKSTLFQDAVQRLVSMAVPEKSAQGLVVRAIEELGADAATPEIANRAMQFYFEDAVAKRTQKENRSKENAGYEALEKKGMIATEVI